MLTTLTATAAKRFVAHANEKLTAFLELESVVRASISSSSVF
jgi:hypothetical protein